MRNPPVAIVCLSALIFFTAMSSGSEPPVKPAKTRLVPRPLPGIIPAFGGGEEHLVRRPVTGGTLGSGILLGQPEEKARIGAIRRKGWDGQNSGPASSGAAEIDASKEGNTEAPVQAGLPPLRPGQIRVLPKAEVKANAVFEVTAQQIP